MRSLKGVSYIFAEPSRGDTVHLLYGMDTRKYQGTSKASRSDPKRVCGRTGLCPSRICCRVGGRAIRPKRTNAEDARHPRQRKSKELDASAVGELMPALFFTARYIVESVANSMRILLRKWIGHLKISEHYVSAWGFFRRSLASASGMRSLKSAFQNWREVKGDRAAQSS